MSATTIEAHSNNVWTTTAFDSDKSNDRKVQPVVLSGTQVAALPMENFSNDTSRATGGWQQMFSAPNTPTNELNIGLARFPPRKPGQESFEALHRHKQAEFYYMLEGECVVRIEGVKYPCKPGHVLFIPGDAEHGFWNTSEETELVFLWGFAADGFRDIVYRFSARLDPAEN